MWFQVKVPGTAGARSPMRPGGATPRGCFPLVKALHELGNAGNAEKHPAFGRPRPSHSIFVLSKIGRAVTGPSVPFLVHLDMRHRALSGMDLADVRPAGRQCVGDGARKAPSRAQSADIVYHGFQAEVMYAGGHGGAGALEHAISRVRKRWRSRAGERARQMRASRALRGYSRMVYGRSPTTSMPMTSGWTGIAAAGDADDRAVHRGLVGVEAA